MAWIKNFQMFAIWADAKGDIGGFVRDPENESGTGVGPIYSPNGNEWFIIVDNAGNVKSTTATP